MSIVFSSALSFLLLIASPFIVWFYEDPALLYPLLAFVLVVFFSGLPLVPRAVLSKELRFMIIGKGEFLRSISQIVLTIGFAVLQFSYWSLIIPLILTPIISFLYFNTYASVQVKVASIRELMSAWRSMKSLTTNLAAFTLVNYWSRNIDKILIGKFYLKSDVGFYQRAYTLLNLPLQMITGVFNTVQFPIFQKRIDQGINFKNDYLDNLKIMTLICIPITIAFIVIPVKLSVLLWGPNWASVGNYFPVFGAILFLQVKASTSGNIFILLRKERSFAQIGIINAVVMITAIIIGAFESVKMVAFMYACSYSLISTPILMYFGFRKTFDYSWKQVLNAWLIDWIVSLFILWFLWINNTFGLNLVMALWVLYHFPTMVHFCKKLKMQTFASK